MTAVKVMHVFYDTWLGFGYASLMEIYHEQTKKGAIDKGEVAVFINKAKVSAKIVTADGVMLYYKGHGPMTTDILKGLPSYFGGDNFQVSRPIQTSLATEIATKLESRVKRMQTRWQGTQATAQ